MNLQFITSQIASINAFLNTLKANAKRIFELPTQTTLDLSSKIHVSRGGVDEQLELQLLVSSLLNNTQNRIISIDDNITKVLLDVIVPPLSWSIQNVIYSTSTDTTIPITLCSSGFNRKDIIVATDSGTVILVNGVESDDIVLRPSIPLDSVLITELDVSDSDIGTPTDPLLGEAYVKKIFSSIYAYSTAGTEQVLPLRPDGTENYTLTNSSLDSVDGFDLSLITGNSSAEVPFVGKKLIIWNQTSNPVTLLDAGSAEIPFNFGVDIIIPSGEKILMFYDGIEIRELFRSWSSSGGASAFTSLTDVPSSYTDNANKVVSVKADESGLEFISQRKSFQYNSNALCLYNFPSTSNWVLQSGNYGLGAFNAAKATSTFSSFLDFISGSAYSSGIGGIAAYDMKLKNNASFVRPNAALFGGNLLFALGYIVLNRPDGTITTPTVVQESIYTPEINGHVNLTEDFSGDIIIPKGAIWLYSWAHTKGSAVSNVYIQTILNFESALTEEVVDTRIVTTDSWNAIGHSIWWQDGRFFSGGGGLAKGTQSFVKEAIKFSYYNNYGYSGYSLGGLTSIDTLSLLNEIDNWVTANVWTLDTITNDFKRNIPIGTTADFTGNTGKTTYYGALRELHEALLVFNPDYKMIAFNALHRDNAGYTSFSTNTEGHTITDYSDALEWVCADLGWSFINQRDDSGITPANLGTYTIDGLHPNNEGYALYPDLLINELLEIIA